MGMELIGADISYSWHGWAYLISKLDEWGVDTREFRGCNDGDPISKETCIAVGNAIEQHLDELDEAQRRFLAPQIDKWRTCDGCEQW